MMPSPRLIAAALLVLCGAASFSLGTRAEPFERDACKALKEQKKILLTKEVKAALKQGPDWVKDHLHSAGDIEKIRQYLLIEEKVEFRCRTDGVRIPKPKPPPLPDPKPPVPLFTAGQKVLAGAAAMSFLPLRKPSASAPERVQAEAAAEAEQGIGDADEVAASAETKEGEPAPSQTVADSDKTAPSETKATQ
jgi:hypothetical protein